MRIKRLWPSLLRFQKLTDWFSEQFQSQPVQMVFGLILSFCNTLTNHSQQINFIPVKLGELGPLI
jgi:hypothetical protein